jgi:acetyl esterase/lipase
MTTKHIMYKKEGDLKIFLTIILPKNAKKVPVLLYFHGFGGLLQGTRSVFAPHLLRSVEKYKLALVTADYRLAPQVAIEDIQHDVLDCIEFIRRRDSKGLAKQLDDPGAIDPKHLAVAGSSAGGLLAFIAGLYADPKPQVILAMYPITDPLGTFFRNDQIYSEYYEGQEINQSKCIPRATIERFLDPNAPVVTNSRGGDRDKLYHWVLSTGEYATYLGFEGGIDQCFNYSNENWRIAKQVVEYGLPPTYICHGTLDIDVDIEQSDLLVGALVRTRTVFEYEEMEGMEHRFDMVGDLTPQSMQRADSIKAMDKVDSMYEFAVKHLPEEAMYYHGP